MAAQMNNLFYTQNNRILFALFLIVVFFSAVLLINGSAIFYYCLPSRAIISYQKEVLSEESESGVVSTVHIPINNNGNIPLKIGNISTSCGCMSVAFNDKILDSSKCEFSIQPSTSAKITVKFRIEGTFGIKTILSLKFQSNDPLNLNCETLIIVPFVNKGVVFAPSKLHLPALKIGEIAEKTINVFETKKPLRTFQEIKTSHPFLNAQFIHKDNIPQSPPSPDETLFFLGQIKVKIYGNQLGDFHNDIYFHLKERPNQPNSLNVSWSVSKLIEVAPSTLLIKEPENGSSRTSKSALCFSPFGESFSIRSITTPEWLTASFNPKLISKSHKITFDFKDLAALQKIKEGLQPEIIIECVGNSTFSIHKVSIKIDFLKSSTLKIGRDYFFTHSQTNLISLKPNKLPKPDDT